MTTIRDIQPMTDPSRSGWRLLVRPQGRIPTVPVPQQLALPLALGVAPAPRLSWWEQVRQFLYEEILFSARTP